VNTDILDITARGISIRFGVGNGRLRVWAERFEEIEPELLDLIDGMPDGAVFFDLGASIGLFSLYAAIQRRARVFAFEAEAQNYAMLELNHFLNRTRIVEPMNTFNIAISDTVGIGRIYTRVYGAGEHGKVLDRAVTQDTKEGFTAEHVQTVLKQPVDHLIAQYKMPVPTVIKIDVDGAEAAVISGASRTLRNPTVQTVFIELSERSQMDEVAALRAHGFALAAKVPVIRLRGGVYPDLFNCIFRR
jgi:FkbM family methyltransferase